MTKVIDCDKLIELIEPLKTVAKLPAISENSKYTMVVPYVELVKIIKGGDQDHTETAESEEG